MQISLFCELVLRPVQRLTPFADTQAKPFELIFAFWQHVKTIRMRIR